MAEEQISTMESVAKGRTVGAFRCLNCYERVSPPPGATTYKCPNCSFEWRVSWPQPNLPRIRGPVWDVNRRLTEEELGKGRKK